MSRAKDMRTARGKLGGYTALLLKLSSAPAELYDDFQTKEVAYKVAFWRAKLNAIPLKRKRKRRSR